tara:strand:- start:302 stop:883 length:582 start_codon:yes stop_codon:yes gene_type:complete
MEGGMWTLEELYYRIQQVYIRLVILTLCIVDIQILKDLNYFLIKMDNSFKYNSNQLLNSLEQTNSSKTLKKIKIKNLKVLVDFISDYKPKSKIKKEETDILKYLNIINNKNLEKIDRKELLTLEKDYIYPFINRFMKYGFRYKFAWLYIFFFVLVFDLILFSFIDIFIPVFSGIYIINAIRKEIIAHRENKLW